MSSAAEHQHHPALAHHFESLAVQTEASILGMWTFLVQEVLFFGAFFMVYTLHRNLYYPVFAACSHHLDWKLGAFNTAVLICSSLTMALAVHGAAVGRRRQIVLFLILTVLLGGVFLGVKVVEYAEKFHHHLAPGAQFSAESLRLPGDAAEQARLARGAEIYYSLYFAMTGLHATHMVIGIPILSALALLAHRGRYGPDYHSPVELTGLYWHFVDIVWIFLFPLLYLIPGRH